MSVHSSIVYNTQKWTQPKYLSTDEWINKMWYIHTMAYYLMIEMNEVLKLATTWIDLKSIMISDRS